MVAVVSGVFSQVADRSPPIRSFTRTLVIVPEGSGYCITNEQLYLTNATVDQIKVWESFSILGVVNQQDNLTQGFIDQTNVTIVTFLNSLSYLLSNCSTDESSNIIIFLCIHTESF